MAQDTSGTSIATNAAAVVREVVYKFYCDWDDTGFAVYPTGWYDESDYVKSVSGTMAAVGWQQSPAAVGSGVSNSVSVVCQNPEETGGSSGLRFSSSNSNGSLYAKLGGGAINMKRAVFEIGFDDSGTPERLVQITGYITRVHEDYAGKTVTFTIQDRGADVAMGRNSTALQTDVEASDYLTTLAGLFERDTASTDFDRGMVLTPYQYLDDETVWDEMGLVAEAQCGRTWFDKDGNLHFDDGTHFVKPDTDSYDDPTTSQATITVANMQALNPFYDLRSVFNHVIVEYQPRYVSYVQPIFTASDIIVLQPGESDKPYHAQFDCPAYAITTPVVSTDYVAVSPGGASRSVTVSVNNAYAASAELYLTNNSASYPAYFTKLQIRGAPLLTQEPIKYSVEDATSISDYGRRTLTVRSNPYCQTYRHAQLVGDLLLERFKDPLFTVKIVGLKGMPWLEPGDRVTVTETLTDIDTDFFITRISWRWSPSSYYAMDLELVLVSDLYAVSDYFIIGTSKYGTGTDHGHLFW